MCRVYVQTGSSADAVHHHCLSSLHPHVDAGRSQARTLTHHSTAAAESLCVDRLQLRAEESRALADVRAVLR